MSNLNIPLDPMDPLYPAHVTDPRLVEQLKEAAAAQRLRDHVFCQVSIGRPVQDVVAPPAKPDIPSGDGSDYPYPKAEDGKKDDGGKARMDLIPPEALFALAAVLGFGASKYAPRNWEKGMSWGRVFAALMRHMWAWWRGEKKDPETGFSHLWHALACISFLVAFEERSTGTDDRAGS